MLKSGNDLYVNLFIASELNWKEKGLVVTQTTQFPNEEKSELALKLKKPGQFTIMGSLSEMGKTKFIQHRN